MRDVIAPIAFCVLLRWAISQDIEAQVAAIFDETDYDQIFPNNFAWRSLKKLDETELWGTLHETILPRLEHLHGSPLADTLRMATYAFDPKKLSPPLLYAALHTVDDLPFETTEDFAEIDKLFTKLFDEYAEKNPPGIGEYITPRRMSELMIEIANPQPSETIYDPCFGLGSLLTEAGRHVVSQAKSLSASAWLNVQSRTLYGIEKAPLPYLIGMTRMILTGINQPHLELGDTLERPLYQPQHQFDLILAAPPIGGKVNERWRAHNFPVKANSTETLFLQHIMASLKPNGRAVVGIPEGFLFRSGADEQVRERLLSDFSVEGVISLPTGSLLPYTRIKPNILVFRKAESTDYVWFQEAQAARKTSSRSPAIFKPHVEARIFRERQESEHAWLLPVQEIAERNFDLSVKRTQANELNSFINELRQHDASLEVARLDEIADVLSGIGYTRADVLNDQLSGTVPLIRVTELAKNGELKPPSLFLYGVALERSRTRRLLPGDLLLSTQGTIGKVGRVREAFTGSVPAHGITTIRLKDGNEQPFEVHPFYLARLLQSGPYQQWFALRALGTTIKNLAVRELRSLPIPIPNSEIQQTIAASVSAGADTSEILKSIVTGRASDEFLSFLLSEPAINDLITTGIDESDSLIQFRRLAAALRPWRNKAAHNRLIGDQSLLLWLLKVSWLVENIVEAFEIPQGADRLALLSLVQNEMDEFDAITSGVNENIRARLWTITEAIKETLARARSRLLEKVNISATIEPAIVDADVSSELEIRFKNNGSLPLRRLIANTTPDVSKKEIRFLQAGESTAWSVPVPPRSTGAYPVTIYWNALRLDGSPVNGEIALEYKVRSVTIDRAAADLGPSPYIVMTPIDSRERPEMFYGREDIINRIQRALRTEGSSTVLLLEGVRRSGKTSILKRLLLPDILPNWIPVYCNFQGGEGSRVAAGLETKNIFSLIAEEIVTAVHRAGYSLNVVGVGLVPNTTSRFEFGMNVLNSMRTAFDSDNPFRHLDLQVEAALDAVDPKRILLVLDEFDKIQQGIENRVTSSQVPENIRSLFHKYSRLSGIITGARRIKNLRENYWSALFGIGLPINVSALDTESARALVTKPVEDRLVFTPQARDLVIELCGRHPYLIQVLCERIFDDCSKTGAHTVTPSIVDVAAEKMIEDNEHFQTLWDYIGTARRRYITCLINRLSKEPDRVTEELILERMESKGFVRGDLIDVDGDLNELRELEVLTMQEHELGSSYALQIPLFSHWITKHIDESIYLRRAISEG
jgi:type I restriction enzyme M protein